MRRTRRRGSPIRRRTSRRTRRSLAIVFALLFAPIAQRTARADCVEFTAPPTISASAGFAKNLVAADVDGDGDLDAVSSSSAGRLYWFANNGAGGTWTLHTLAAVAHSPYNLALADLDGDGDLDAVSGAFSDSSVTWFRNGGTDDWTLQTIAAGSVPGAFAVATGDVDDDGDVDVFASGFGVPDEISWFANDGTGGGWAKVTIATAINNAASLTAADIDGDGDLDVVAARYLDNRIAWYENSNVGGNGSTWVFHALSTTGDAGGPYSVDTADVDGDGDLDALAAEYGDGEIVWYENDGTPKTDPWTGHVVATTASQAYSVAHADVDGDGDVDLVSASKGDNLVAWYENLGGGASFRTHTASTAVPAAHAVAVGDFDGDGDSDFLFSSQTPQVVGWLRNDRLHDTALFAPTATISSSAGDLTSVFAADLDRDGDLDALFSTFNSNLIGWYENLAASGDGSSWTLHAVSTAANRSYAVVAADIDGDGDPDVVSANYSTGVFWHDNTAGNASVWSAVAIFSAAVGAHSVAASDLDGDGDLDALSAQAADDRIAWHENLSASGDGSSWTMHEISNSSVYADSVVAADLDGDGDPDVLGASLNDTTIAWFENDGSPATGPWTESVISGTVSGARSVFAADLDRDGDLDVLWAADLSQTAGWYENDGTPLDGGWVEHLIATNASSAHAVFGADADGDGDVDVLAATAGAQKIVWYENDGTPKTGPWTAHALPTAAGASFGLFAADVDGDGDLDALSAGFSDSTIAWHRNLGTGVFDDGFDSDANKACWSSAVP